MGWTAIPGKYHFRTFTDSTGRFFDSGYGCHVISAGIFACMPYFPLQICYNKTKPDTYPVSGNSLHPMGAKQCPAGCKKTDTYKPDSKEQAHVYQKI